VQLLGETDMTRGTSPEGTSELHWHKSSYSSSNESGDCVEIATDPPTIHVRDSKLAWFKSSYSDSSNPSDCVEIAAVPPTILIRDSKNPGGPRLAVEPGTWAEFVAYVSGV
jgi:hypothetical protein